MPVIAHLPHEPWRDPSTIVDGEFRWRLGVRPLDVVDWFEFGPDADGWIAEKAEVMSTHPNQAFVALDDAGAECSEIADAVVAHLAERHQDRPRKLDGALHPLDAAARLVPEDFAVMVERDGRLVFGAGSVCFPNRWDLPSKLGQTMRDVHAPVADLNDQLDTNIDRFLEKLTPERSFTRLGWGIIGVSDGFTPPGERAPSRPEASALEDRFVRVERETLRRFPKTGCVLFTIRTYITPVASVMTDPGSFRSLTRAVAAMPLGIATYKDVLDLR